MRIGILEPDGFSSEALLLLNQLGSVSLFLGDDLEAFCQSLNVLFVRLDYIIDSHFLNHCPELSVICSPTTGLTHIDQKQLESRSIHLISLRGHDKFLSTITPTPEHALGLTISLLRNYRKCFDQISNTIWDRTSLRGYEIQGSSVGLVGFGRVGRILAKYFNCMNAKVFAFDPFVDDFPAHVMKVSSLESLIENTSIIILCASVLNPAIPIINSSHLYSMKNKFFVNISRGELVDENCLFDLASDNHFAGVAMDVLTCENTDLNLLKPWSDLFVRSNNIIITPHIGGACFSAMHKTECYIVNLLKQFIVDSL